jgi:metal-sulfur cluster biosynthetic enzyme
MNTNSMGSEPTKKVTWQAETTHPDLIEPFRDALRTIVDPEIGLNVIELGLIRDLQIVGDSADVTMILTTPFCPYGPAMIETTRLKAEEALGRPTHIQMGMEMWDFSMMEEGAAPDWGLY